MLCSKPILTPEGPSASEDLPKLKQPCARLKHAASRPDIGGPRNRTNWDRVTRTEEGDFNSLPLLLVGVLIAIGKVAYDFGSQARCPGDERRNAQSFMPWLAFLSDVRKRGPALARAEHADWLESPPRFIAQPRRQHGHGSTASA